ncbi:MAG: riboflavin synthase [Planctomycetota bacterium]
MFSGIVEGTGRVIALEPGVAGAAARLRVSAPAGLVRDVVAGASVAINGCCLSAVIPPDAPPPPGELWFDVVEQTLQRTNLGALTPGQRVNLERAMALGSRIDGHFVQGHIDATGEVLSVEPADGQTVLRIAAPPDVARYCIPRGSIAIDGVSLTLATFEPANGELSVALIPTTLAVTALGDRVRGDRVNLEADMLGKYVVGWLERSGR